MTATAAFPEAMVKDLSLHYCVHVGTVGEDGDLLALGHHDMRRVIAAWNRYVRTELGWSNLREACWPRNCDDLADKAESLWAVLTTACGDATEAWHATDCGQCEEIKAGPWWISWNAQPSDAGVFPVMIWEA